MFSLGLMELVRIVNHINHYEAMRAQWRFVCHGFSILMTEVEKDGRHMSNLLEGSAFGEMAVLGLTSGQSVTIKA